VDKRGKTVDFLLRRHRGGTTAITKGESRWRYVEVRTRKYLNNIVEQDHRAIKRRCTSMKGLKSFTNAVITIASIELARRIHKRQFSFGLGQPRRNCSLKVQWQRALA
jgi:transposase-like protein